MSGIRGLRNTGCHLTFASCFGKSVEPNFVPPHSRPGDVNIRTPQAGRAMFSDNNLFASTLIS